MRKALRTATDLEQARRQLESNDVTLQEPVRPALPALDLTASYGLAGSAARSSSARERPRQHVIETIPGGFSDALAIAGAIGPRRPGTLAVNFSYPIGTSPAEANLARARVQQRQTIAQRRQLELQIATEVTNAALQVERTASGCRRPGAARELAEKRLEAEQSRFDVGLSTNFFVVQAQRDLRDAQNSELRALLDYRRAHVDFERVQESPAARRHRYHADQAGGGTACQRRWRLR